MELHLDRMSVIIGSCSKNMIYLRDPYFFFLVALPLCLGVAFLSSTYSGILSGIIGGIVVALVSGSDLAVSILLLV